MEVKRMAKVCEKKYSNAVYYKYEISNVRNNIEALKWFADIIMNKIHDVKTIEIDDLQSFHDGSESIFLSSIEDADDFVRAYDKTAKWISASFVFNSCSTLLQIDIAHSQIILCFDYGCEHYSKELEQLLGLV